MARISIENIRKLEKSRNSVHEKVETTYTIFKMDGEKYVQIDTYGRIGRENPEKISQSFQLDRSTALFLVHISDRRCFYALYKRLRRYNLIYSSLIQRKRVQFFKYRIWLY